MLRQLLRASAVSPTLNFYYYLGLNCKLLLHCLSVAEHQGLARNCCLKSKYLWLVQFTNPGY